MREGSEIAVCGGGQQCISSLHILNHISSAHDVKERWQFYIVSIDTVVTYFF